MSAEGRTDSSVEFLQREHARTLRGLHNEINNLQQKCARLTFELTMTGGSQSGSKECNGAQHDEPWLKKALADSQETLSLLQGKLEATEYQVGLLKHEKNLMMKKFEEQMDNKDAMIMSLHMQLEEKSNTIAQLVHKAHQMQRLLQRGGEGTSNQQEKPPLLPLLPKELPPEMAYRTNKITRRVRKPNHTDAMPGSGQSSSERRRPLVTESLPTKVLFDNPSAVAAASRLSQSCVYTPNEVPSPTAFRTPRNRENNQLSSIGSTSTTVIQPPLNLLTASAGLVNEEPKMTTKMILPPIKDDVKLPPITLPSGPKPQQTHRRFHLAKTQGLTSAPPCSLRLAGRTRCNEEEVLEEEGRLLVKYETNGLNHRIHHQQEFK